MNFKPNFENYKRDQEKLEIIPEIKTEFYFDLNDISKKILSNYELNDEDLNNLEMVYGMTQNLDNEIITFFDDSRAQEVITRLECLIISNYFLIAHQKGPDSTELKDKLIGSVVSVDEFKNIIQKLSIPKNIKELIVEIYKKIKDSKNNK